MRWDRRGVLALLTCLVLAGAIGALTPSQLPSVRPVAPDQHGVVTTETLTVELLDVRATDEVTSQLGTAYATPATFVVVTFAAQAHRDYTLLSPRLRSPGGQVHWPVTRGEIQQSFSVAVGQRITTSVVFEVAPENVPGSTFTVAPHINNGIVPVVRTATYALPDPLPEASEPPVMSAPTYEAGR